MFNLYHRDVSIRCRDLSAFSVESKAKLIGGIICLVKIYRCPVIVIRVASEFVSCRCSIRVIKLRKHALQGNLLGLHIISINSVLYPVKNNRILGTHVILIGIIMPLTIVIVITGEAGLMIKIIVRILVDAELIRVKIDRRGRPIKIIDLLYRIGRPTIIRPSFCSDHQIKRSIIISGSQVLIHLGRGLQFFIIVEIDGYRISLWRCVNVLRVRNDRKHGYCHNNSHADRGEAFPHSRVS